MRATDLVQSIWGSPSPANSANPAHARTAPPTYSHNSQLSQGRQATPTLDALLATHGDGSAAGVDWSAWRLTTATRSATWAVINRRGLTLLFTVEPIPQPRSYPQAWPVERIAPWPDVEDNAEDFEERAGILEFDAGLAREAAEREARRLIEASRWCSGCRHMDALRRPDDARPHCAIGHALTWRQVGPGGVLTRPGRSDARDCGDRTPGSHV